MPTAQPRKARKLLYNLPNHLARRNVSAHLSEELIKKYDRRTLTLRKGDTVRILRGDYKGTAGKVLELDVKARLVTVEGVTVEKADKTKKARPVAASNLVITRLDLGDKLRREMLGEKEVPEDAKPKKSKKKEEAKPASAEAEPAAAREPASSAPKEEEK